MKLTATLIFLLTANLVLGQSLNDLNWLKGEWERQNVKEGQTAFEIWDKAEKDEMKGTGLTKRGADTVFIEQLSIIKKEDTLYYVAIVSQNQKPTLFKFTSLTKNGFVCENPNHDFPKKITYQLDGKQMTATISGDGKSIPFIFNKVK